MVQAVPGKEADSAEMSDDWRRIEMFMQTLEDYELLDTEVAAESVLWRLFHDDEVLVKPSMPLSFQCSCRAENIRAVLSAYPVSELKDLPDPDGVIRTRCEFCGNTYEFPLAEFGT
jgi:molecular chaperone Hsp33